MTEKKIHFISGHLNLTVHEFAIHYKPLIDEALANGDSFVIGDARGADYLAQKYLFGKSKNVTVYHMFENPRNNQGFPTVGGFKSDAARDARMTSDSTHDIAWVRAGRKSSGTQQNINRRKVR